ncbi:MAG: DUF4474 domain-containing protein [Flavobacteriaceae bacterium]|jgi:RHS repeat-associated protein|nr:DUF4474 domain-containing protein [Flavobacteriaceae bacterium]
MVALKPVFMHSLKTSSLTVQTTTQCVSEAFFTPENGARYLNPQTGLWLSTDPAMGEYVPQAPINDDAKKYNQSLAGMGGVFNVVNLHVYHYAGNNPVKYTDPDGREAIHGGRYPGFSEDAPQAQIPYWDIWDAMSLGLGFIINGTKLDFGSGYLRLWKGDYNNVVAHGFGGAGGEIGFYDYNNMIIKGAELSKLIGLENSSMQVYLKGNNLLIAEYSELSGWVTAFNVTTSAHPNSMYMISEFTFSDDDRAEKFANNIRRSILSGKETGMAEHYYWNAGEKISVSQNGREVTVTWGIE